MIQTIVSIVSTAGGGKAVFDKNLQGWTAPLSRTCRKLILVFSLFFFSFFNLPARDFVGRSIRLLLAKQGQALDSFLIHGFDPWCACGIRTCIDHFRSRARSKGIGCLRSSSSPLFLSPSNRSSVLASIPSMRFIAETRRGLCDVVSKRISRELFFW